jgi:hypothetical protein
MIAFTAEEIACMTTMQKKILVSTSIAVLVALLLGCLVGFAMGHAFFFKTHVCPVAKKHAVGYSVVSSDKIVTCCSDTLTYNWNKWNN